MINRVHSKLTGLKAFLDILQNLLKFLNNRAKEADIYNNINIETILMII